MNNEYEFTNLDNFEDLELLGNKGEFEFHKIRQKNTGSIYCAIIFTYDFDEIGRNQMINLNRELTILPQLNHPSIQKFIGYSPLDFSSNSRPVIITEFYPTLSLYQTFSSEITQKLIIIYGIVAGMAYLHSHNIIHRDLKFDTICVDDRLFPKISGFHLCKQINPNVTEKSDFIKGTPAYLAPEVFIDCEYSKASDVYSFSLIFYQLMTNVELYKDIKERPDLLGQLVTNGERPTFFGDLPECYRNLIQKCWSQNRNDRPTFSEIRDELKNNSSFIIDGVREEEYRNYIKYIDESIITFDQTRKFHQFNSNEIESRMFEFNFSVQTIFDTQLDNVLVYMKYFDLNNFTKERRIGRGRYSDVYEIVYHHQSGINYAPFAAKIFNEKMDDIYDYYSDEVIINTQLNHRSICRYIGYNPATFCGKKYPVIIFEYYPNSSLDHLISLERKKINFPNWNATTKLIIIYGIAAGMAYLHSQNIVHRDLNPKNIFLDFNLFPKIGDFGTADYSFESSSGGNEEEDEYYRSFIVNHTPLFMSPETLLNNESTKASDVYSFAIIVYEILMNKSPFEGLNFYEIVKEVVENKRRPNLDEEMPDCFRNLIERCWAHEPNERPTFDAIVKQLRTDSNFISEGIQKERFLKYIQFIDGENVVFDEPTSNENILNCHFDLIKTEIKQLNINVDSIDLSKFEIHKEKSLGEGSFGTVYEVIEKETGQTFAAKILNRYLEDTSNNNIVNINREVNNSSELNFPSIVKFIGYNQHNFSNKPKLTIITELVPNGTLDDLLKSERNNSCLNKNWNETKKLIVIYGIAAGMAYCHSRNIIHRDLKPANIFMDEKLNPKIGDFGLSKNIFSEDSTIKNSEMKSGIKGSYAFLAPEVFTALKYDKAGDVYAFALIVYEMMTLNRSYRDLSRYRIMLQVPKGVRPEIGDNAPDCYRKLICRCWSGKPEERPTFDEIVNLLKTDDFISKNVDRDVFLSYVHEIDQSFNHS